MYLNQCPYIPTSVTYIPRFLEMEAVVIRIKTNAYHSMVKSPVIYLLKCMDVGRCVTTCIIN